MRVVLTGGGTGGHTTPLIAVADALRRANTNVELYFVGVVTPGVAELARTYDIPTLHIPAGKIRRYPSLLNFFDLLFRGPVGLLVAFLRMWWLMPDVVVSKGGYGSVSPVLAAWFYRIPILIHESDVVPGAANIFLSRFATAIAVGFTATREKFKPYDRKVVVTGTPIRFDFIPQDQAAAKTSFGFSAESLVVLITGGSQGAEQINEVVLKVLPQLVTEVCLIHLTGPTHYPTVAAVAEQLLAESPHKKNYRAFPELQEKMPLALSAADIIVSRAGATTLAEIARLKKAALLVPLPHAAQDNQRANATAFEQQGAARVLDSNNLGTNLFHRALEELIASSSLRQELGRRAAQFDRPAAARDVAELAQKLAQGLAPAYTR